MLILQPLEATLFSRGASSASNFNRGVWPSRSPGVLFEHFSLHPPRQCRPGDPGQSGQCQSPANAAQSGSAWIASGWGPECSDKTLRRLTDPSWKAFWAFRFWEAKPASHVSHRRLWGWPPRINLSSTNFDGFVDLAAVRVRDLLCQCVVMDMSLMYSIKPLRCWIVNVSAERRRYMALAAQISHSLGILKDSRDIKCVTFSIRSVFAPWN